LLQQQEIKQKSDLCKWVTICLCLEQVNPRTTFSPAVEMLTLNAMPAHECQTKTQDQREYTQSEICHSDIRLPEQDRTANFATNRKPQWNMPCRTNIIQNLYQIIYNRKSGFISSISVNWRVSYTSIMSPSDRTTALGSTQLLVKISIRDIPGGKCGRCVRLTTSQPSKAECHEILEPKPPRTLWVTQCLLRDSFTFTMHIHNEQTNARLKIRSITYRFSLPKCFGHHVTIIKVYCNKNTINIQIIVHKYMIRTLNITLFQYAVPYIFWRAKRL
jgi:hypothetical protein